MRDCEFVSPNLRRVLLSLAVLAAFCSPPLFIRPFGAAAEKCVRRHCKRARAVYYFKFNELPRRRRTGPHIHTRRLPAENLVNFAVNEFDQVPSVPAKSFRVDKFYEVWRVNFLAE